MPCQMACLHRKAVSGRRALQEYVTKQGKTALKGIAKKQRLAYSRIALGNGRLNRRA
jgi:hypothetical protein